MPAVRSLFKRDEIDFFFAGFDAVEDAFEAVDLNRLSGGGLKFNVGGRVFAEGRLNGQKSRDFNIEPGLLDDLFKYADIFQIPGVARVFFGNDQNIFGAVDAFVDGVLHQAFGIDDPVFAQIVETCREKVGVDDSDFKGVADVDRSIERGPDAFVFLKPVENFLLFGIDAGDAKRSRRC